MGRVQMDEEDRDTYENYLNIIVPRGTPPKCLGCGSEDFVRLSRDSYEVIAPSGLSAILGPSYWARDAFFPRYYDIHGNHLGRDASLELFKGQFKSKRDA